MICEELLGRKKNSQYVGYINNIISLFDANGLSKTLNHLDDAFKLDKGKTLDYLRNVSEILRKLKSSRGFSFKLDNKNLQKKTIEDYRSALNSYIQILEQNVLDSHKPNKWKQEYGEESDTVYDLAHQIDGTESLLGLIEKDGKIARMNFVKKVLADSYFFDPKDVKKQFEDIKEKYKQEEKIFARWTQWYNSKKDPTSPNSLRGKKKDDIVALSQEDGKEEVKYHIKSVNKWVPVYIDEDGNKKVRDLIEEKTGYLVSAGEKSNFIFYKISHIWGEAYDPRYFTNLWNIVLVPAWANDLLDKRNSKDKLTILFQQVIKKVCIQYYEMESLQWDNINMGCPSYKNDGEVDSIEKYRDGKKSIDIKIRIFKSKGAQDPKESFATIGYKTIKL